MGPGSLERTVSVSHLHGPLMSAGQETDFSCDEVFISRFPIHRACRDGDVGALVSLSHQLPDQAPLTAEDSCYGWTPIHWAAHYGQLECVVRLVQMGCEVNMVTSRFNQTPTHTAAFGGHPQCVVWLTQAGADVNRQDFVGEAPIHKAARSGSLECVQVLLIAGAKPHLRNASGQTAADLAHAHGFFDCSRFISNAQKQLQQLNTLRVGGDTASGQSLLSRKRLLTAVESGHAKRAKRADNVLLQMHISAGEEVESMNVESGQELSSDDDSKAFTNGHHHHHHSQEEPVNQLPAAGPTQHSSADMCGSLHLTGSPSSCVSQRPAWWGLMGADLGDFQQYGHYHGFGDTAEELSDGRHKAAVAGTVHLYRGS
ncbi:ankyrin repeat domain-containing protein 10-like isoform X2 [Seriola lalandi dorsalis]|uniref:ankyrin repeat domain-containing protein 10-like isoform X2 n=1 Tax=Seriola lalandi dorsalis TaxID=1841481 RepID=UPI000C6FAF9B|nr:ankyrin repeat domain-containing protein 10-like isoform X2 [Seriola lalandi dorsalis]